MERKSPWDKLTHAPMSIHETKVNTVKATQQQQNWSNKITTSNKSINQTEMASPL